MNKANRIGQDFGTQHKAVSDEDTFFSTATAKLLPERQVGPMLSFRQQYTLNLQG